MGLWITKGIVDLHCGRISVNSTGEGHGCTFKVEMPMLSLSSIENRRAYRGYTSLSSSPSRHVLTMVPHIVMSTKEPELGITTDCEHINHHVQFETDDSADINLGIKYESQRNPLTTVSQKSSSPSYRLLVVDDSQLNRKMLVRVMKAKGHNCEEAEDGQQAVDCIKRIITTTRQETSELDGAGVGAAACREFDAILMDFMMPVMDSPSATKQIRELSYKGKIFGVTGNALRSDIDHFIDMGANDVLIKPLDMILFDRVMSSNI